MAKGNMLQGMARGKVGDVVFSRLNGQQISRVRNRQPYNPRTNKQLIQRAIMATVMLGYSAGKEIFNHSFQGKAVGAENQREFMRLNAKALRAAIANDLNNDVALANQVGRVVGPKAYAPTPFKCIISKGTYPQNFFKVATNGRDFTFEDKETGETCAAYCARVGLVPGDIYTFVAFKTPTQDDATTLEDALKNPAIAAFAYKRLQVKADALTDTTAIGSQLATVQATNGVPFVVTEQTENVQGQTIMFDTEDAPTFGEIFGGTGSYGVIRSREDSDLRSDSEMLLSFNTASPSYNWGIASQYIIDIWAAGATPVGDSDLILEGGDI